MIQARLLAKIYNQRLFRIYTIEKKIIQRWYNIRALWLMIPPYKKRIKPQNTDNVFKIVVWSWTPCKETCVFTCNNKVIHFFEL